METTTGQGSESSFKELIGIIWRQKWVLFLTLMVAIAAAAAFTVIIEPTYQSTGKLIVEGRTTPNQIVQKSNDPTQAFSATSTDDVPTQVEQIQSRSVLVDALAQVTQANPAITPKSSTDVEVTAKQIGQTNGIELTVTSPNPQLSQLVATQIPETFRQIVQERNSTELRQGVEFVTRQLDLEQESLTSAERDLDAFRKRNDISPSPSDGAERNTAVLNADQRLNLAEAEYEGAKKSFEAYVAARKGIPARIPDATIEQNLSTIQMVKDRISQLEGKRQSLLETYTADSREVKAADAEIAEARAALAAIPTRVDNQRTTRNPLIPYYDQQVESAKANMESAAARLTQARQFSGATRQRMDAFTKIVAELSRQQREIDLKRANVSQLTTQLNQLKLFVNQIKNPIQVIQEPSDAVRNRPNPPLYVAIALFVGTILAGAIALAKDRLEDRVSNLEQAFRISGAPTLGYVPSLPAGKKQAPRTTLKALPGRIQENYRIVRSNVLFGLKESQDKTLLVTSTGSNEGASDVAANLATALASSGKSTILIDVNLNEPSQHDRFSLPVAPGLSNVLAGANNLSDVILETGSTNLSLIPAGTADMISGDLLGSEHMEKVLEELRGKFELIVLDAPPMMPRSDALALASITDTVIYVVKPGFTNKSTMKYCVELLRHSRARLLGLVFTDTDFRSEDL
jgi:capsular exopolysaccharide synthesis family protein